VLSWSWQCMDAYFQKYRYKNNFSFVICVTCKLLSNFCFLCLITVVRGKAFVHPCMNMWLIVNLYVPHYQFYELLFYNNSLLNHTLFHSSVAPKTLSNMISLLVHFDNCLELTTTWPTRG